MVAARVVAPLTPRPGPDCDMAAVPEKPLWPWVDTVVTVQVPDRFRAELLGVNGATTLAATIGQISVSQTGTALTGTITNSIQKVGYNFTGTLSSGSLTITGSTTCGSGSNNAQSTSIVGTINSNSASGTYTITRGSNCYSYNDAGTFAATKQ